MVQETLLIELVGEQQGLWQAISVQAQTVKVLAYALINGQRGPNRRARSQTLSIDVKLIALIVGFLVRDLPKLLLMSTIILLLELVILLGEHEVINREWIGV